METLVQPPHLTPYHGPVHSTTSLCRFLNTSSTLSNLSNTTIKVTSNPCITNLCRTSSIINHPLLSIINLDLWSMSNSHSNTPSHSPNSKCIHSSSKFI